MQIKIKNGEHFIEVVALTDDQLLLAETYDDQPQGEIDRRWWMPLTEADDASLLVEDTDCAAQRENLFNIGTSRGIDMSVIQNPLWFLDPSETLVYFGDAFLDEKVSDLIDKYGPEFVEESKSPTKRSTFLNLDNRYLPSDANLINDY